MGVNGRLFVLLFSLKGYTVFWFVPVTVADMLLCKQMIALGTVTVVAFSSIKLL